MKLILEYFSALFLVLMTGDLCRGQNITVNNDLVFGDVFPAIPKVIAKTTAGSAAEFYVSGTAGDEVTIDFTLPTYMNDGGNHMQLIFNKTDCAMDSSAAPDQTNPGYNNLDPWHTLTYRLGSNGLTIWLGGTVVPQIIQRQGSYSGSIVLTVAYTGN
jgi:hypothetical protein